MVTYEYTYVYTSYLGTITDITWLFNLQAAYWISIYTVIILVNEIHLSMTNGLHYLHTSHD